MLLASLSPALSQEKVSVEIDGGTRELDLRLQIGYQTQALLTAINNAALSNSKTIDFRGIKISQSACNTIMMLWENTHFKTIDDEIVEKCIEISAKRHDKSYLVRNIEVGLIPLNNSCKKMTQEICVEFDKQGEIIDFAFALDKWQTRIVLKEGELLEDINRRMFIIDFCDKLKTAFLTKNISFLDSVLSDDIVFINSSNNTIGQDYEKKNKDYIRKLRRLFNRKSWCDVEFNDLKIMPHASKPQYYGASFFSVLRMGTEASHVYSDTSRIFMVWEFSEEDNAELKFFCLQPATTTENEMYNIESFNLE